MISSIFFDLDGTLCVPRVPFSEIFTASCAPLHALAPDIPAMALLAAWSAAVEAPGRSTSASCLAEACARCGVSAPGRLIDECAQALNSAWVGAQVLLPDTADVLDDLVARGYRIGLITNGPSDAQRGVVAGLDLERWCRYVVVSGDAAIGVRKPNPAVFAHALGHAGAQAGETWFVGDNPLTDIVGAARAGMRTVWLATPEATLPVGVPEPTARIARLAELPVLLSQPAST